MSFGGNGIDMIKRATQPRGSTKARFKKIRSHFNKKGKYLISKDEKVKLTREELFEIKAEVRWKVKQELKREMIVAGIFLAILCVGIFFFFQYLLF